MSAPLSPHPTVRASRQDRWAERILIALASGGFVLFALQLLYSAFCAFSWQNFLMMDYGAYTNFLYNLAHGDGFRFLTDHNYLKTHLSFSFILLTPLVHLWESPLLLIAVQWGLLMGGCGLIWKALRRGKVSPALSMAILFCFVAYPMTQSVMISEFHGVSAYFLLFPWLFYTAAYAKKWAVLPVLLILGLREDAGLLILPMLLYFSCRDRWKTGFVLAALSLLYVVLAITILYPWINGVSLLGVRASEASSQSVMASWLGGHWGCRLQAAGWLFLPAAALGLILRNGWRPLVIFSSVAFLIGVSSAMHRQHSFDFHYPAATTTLLVCAMVWVASNRRPRPHKMISARLQQIAGLALILVTLLAHLQRGYFLGGGKSNRVYTKIHPMVFPLLRLAETTPQEGLLLCNQRLATYFAHRPDIMVTHYYNPDWHAPEWIITDLHELQTPNFAPVLESLHNGEFGLYAQESPFLALKRDHQSAESPELLARLNQNHMVAALMLSHDGEIIDDPLHGLLKQWDGDGDAENPLLAYGRAILLPAGDYIAHFDLRTPVPADSTPHEVGLLSVHPHNQLAPIAFTNIQLTPGDSFAEQSLPFHLSEPTLTEPQVQGGNRLLQVRSIRIQAVHTR